ncbi:MAG TPA: Asp-tRNA(Asn)/Glu-tRNA(Gln) amidotransferase subunit GatC [Clostridiales bacterium]|nr:Asp-tRNA(Asn)/Glu-tRNA(Gln) amidotransferase subunit GatC [Clostridiales bacterium]
MSFSKETIDYIAELSRIGLSEKEKEDMVAPVEKILACMDKLEELDTTNIEPMEHIVSAVNVFREDKVEKSYDRDIILANAPEHEDGCYSVPKIVE